MTHAQHGQQKLHDLGFAHAQLAEGTRPLLLFAVHLFKRACKMMLARQAAASHLCCTLESVAMLTAD